MRLTSIKTRRSTGMTLIEALIYMALLSFLLAGFIQLAYGSDDNALKSLDEVQDAYSS